MPERAAAGKYLKLRRISDDQLEVRLTGNRGSDAALQHESAEIAVVQRCLSWAYCGQRAVNSSRMRPGMLRQRNAAAMSGSAKSDQLRLGFMETIEVDGRGHIGGLLITNQNGRPLEFQCTTPVRANRTQEILFGETLKPWLLGELIGSTLLERVAIKPSLVVTSDPCLLELRNHTQVPVAVAETATGKATGGTENRRLQLGGSVLRFHDAHHGDVDSLQKQKHLIPDSADLQEPLERVREALAETVRTVFAR